MELMRSLLDKFVAQGRIGPTALPTYLTIPEPVVILATLSDVGRLAKFKMADCKPEALYISGLELHIVEMSTATPTFSNMPNSMVIRPTLCDVGRLAELEMADSEPEVHNRCDM
jgi:hypothetical protein